MFCCAHAACLLVVNNNRKTFKSSSGVRRHEAALVHHPCCAGDSKCDKGKKITNWKIGKKYRSTGNHECRHTECDKKSPSQSESIRHEKSKHNCTLACTYCTSRILTALPMEAPRSEHAFTEHVMEEEPEVITPTCGNFSITPEKCLEIKDTLQISDAGWKIIETNFQLPVECKINALKRYRKEQSIELFPTAAGMLESY